MRHGQSAGYSSPIKHAQSYCGLTSAVRESDSSRNTDLCCFAASSKWMSRDYLRRSLATSAIKRCRHQAGMAVCKTALLLLFFQDQRGFERALGPFTGEFGFRIV
jgi:hypothetical protein